MKPPDNVAEGEVALQPHIIDRRGVPERLPQDYIYYGKHMIGLVGMHKNAGICLNRPGIPESIQHQIKLVVAERDVELFGGEKLDHYERKVSWPPRES